MSTVEHLPSATEAACGRHDREAGLDPVIARPGRRVCVDAGMPLEPEPSSDPVPAQPARPPNADGPEEER